MDQTAVVEDPDYEERDISDWELSGDEQLGTKPKRWLIEPETNWPWLMKEATFSRPSRGAEYRKGDDWAERVACAIAQALEIRTARVELAVDRSASKETYGIVSRSILGPKVRLVLGNALLEDRDLGVTRGDRSRYTVDAVRLVLEGVPPPEGSADLTSWEVFVGYLVLDALIGNTDRHEENWAVVETEETRRLAPSFDHASSLGFLLSDSQRQERLVSRDRNFTPEGWADRARTKFAASPHPVEVVLGIRQSGDSEIVDRWLLVEGGVDELVAPIWRIPEHRMSATSKNFAERVLRRNWERLTTRSR